MKTKFKYARIDVERNSLFKDKIVVLRPNTDFERDGWSVVQLVDEYKERYGFHFRIETKNLKEYKFKNNETTKE